MRTLAIGMDAADRGLVLDWIARGELPALGALAERGGVVHLDSQPPFSPEATWSTMITGCRPDKHGTYNWRAIVPGTNRLARSPSRSHRQPFWTQLRRPTNPQRALVIDVPYASRIEDEGLVQVLGWGQRGATRHESWPEGLLDRLNSRHGRYPEGLDLDHRGRRRAGRTRLQALKRLTETRAGLTIELMREHDWDLCLVAFFETHYGGHSFHRYLDPRSVGHDVGARWHSSSLLELYRTFDNAVARLVEEVGPDVNVIVFSGFGMRANTNGVLALDQVLTGLGYLVPARRSAAATRTAFLRRAAIDLAPASLRRGVKRRLAAGTVERHFERLWIESIDWGRTVAYQVSEPGHCFVQLAHPERQDAPALRREIAAEIRQLTDADSGEPAATDVLILDELLSGPKASALPDLAVEWSQERFLRRLRHPRLGVVEEDMDNVMPSEHTQQGFAIAAGPGISTLRGSVDGSLTDLAPTLLHLHGLPVPDEMDGTPFDLLEDSLGPPRREPIDIADEDPWVGC